MGLSHDEAIELVMMLNAFDDAVLRKEDVLVRMEKKRQLVDRIRELKEKDAKKQYVANHNNLYIKAFHIDRFYADQRLDSANIRIHYSENKSNAQLLSEKEKGYIENWFRLEFEEATE